MSGSFLEMADEDFLKQSPPEPVSRTDPPAGEDTQEAAPPAEETVAAPSAESQDSLAGASDEEILAQDSVPEATKTDDTVSGAVGADTVPGTAPATEPEKETDPSGSEKKPGAPAATEAAGTVDYEGFYKQVMAPFKANGKTIELRSPAEAIQLMQMGANYTRKMQELAPHRKVLLMLENNGLLDEGKLSFLIDLNQKNPEAIKKLVKDAGVDPMEIDTSAEPAYQPGNHRVTDEEAAFRSTLADLRASASGLETIKTIDGDWDQASKQILWQHPDLLSVIHEQREKGIYGRIKAEVDRRKTLGLVPAGTPFLQAYKTIGDQMEAAGAFNDLADLQAPAAPANPQATAQPAGQAPTTTPPVVTTRVAAPRPTVTNEEKAAAASTTRAAPKRADAPVNYLQMKDDDFLKLMEGRV